MRLNLAWGALALAAALMMACDATGPNGKDFIGEYDLVSVEGAEPPILVRSDTVPAVYMKGVHLEILESGWNWIVTMQHGLDPAAPTSTRTDFGTWRIGAVGLLLREEGYSGEMAARFSADGRLLLSACSGFLACTEWEFVRAQ